MKLLFKSLEAVLAQETNGDKSLVDLSLRTDSVFCQSLVSTGMLTEEQMQRAAEHYRLGRTKDDGVVFWEIDEQQRIRDGKIMWYQDNCHRIKDKNASWVTARLKKQCHLSGLFDPQRCLFGLHLLGSEKVKVKSEKVNTIAVVEAEKTAVICSELFPQFIWMAAGGKEMLNAGKLYPLREHKVVLFPDTDPTGKTYESWYEKAEAIQSEFRYPIRVSRILEDRATEVQKSAQIDIVDLLFRDG